MAEPLSSVQLFQVYTSIWQNIQREDGNVNARIGWALSITSGQLAAIAFITPAAFNPVSTLEGSLVIAGAVWLLSMIGIYFCYRTHIGVDAAHQQIDYLRSRYGKYADEFEQNMCLPKPFGHAAGNQPGRKSSRVYPLALLTLWSMIAIASTIGIVWTVSRLAARV